MLDTHFKFEVCDDIFAKSKDRALASFISKNNVYKDNVSIPFVNTCISFIILYGSEACWRGYIPI